MCPSSLLTPNRPPGDVGSEPEGDRSWLVGDNGLSVDELMRSVGRERGGGGIPGGGPDGGSEE